MNSRERHLAALLFQTPDRIPISIGGGRKSTLENWRKQGLPPAEDPVLYAARQVSLPLESLDRRDGMGVDFRMIPHFEEKVIERRANSQVVQDWKGNICEIGLEYDVSYLRNAIDFVTRNWIKCPVRTRSDWEDMKRRYDAAEPARFGERLPQWIAGHKDHSVATGMDWSGPFWQLREWLGAEELCMLLADDPGWAAEMVQFWQEFVCQVLERAFQRFVPDCVLVNEDMAYKEHSFISPEMCRCFLMPCWQRWARLCRQAGVKVLEVDSDGHVGQLLPLWIEAGFNCNSPQEVAAGNDLPSYRRLYAKAMSYRGGVDKRKMAAGGAALRSEIERLTPVLRAGGYIPSCDHGIPADVSWPNYLEFCRLLGQAAGWL